MKKEKIMKNLKRVMTLALSSAMLVTQMPVISLAAEQETAALADANDGALQEETSKAESSTESFESENPIQEIFAETAETQESSIEEEPETESSFAAVDNAVADDQGFDIDSNNVLVKYTGTAEDVVIPEGVVTISNGAFESNTTIKTLTLSSTVKSIGNRAFYGCSGLKKVTFNEGLQTIGHTAFQDAPLGEISNTTGLAVGVLEIPGSVTEIGPGAFSGCENLSEVIFNNNGTDILNMKPHSTGPNYDTFSKCENLTKVTFPDRLQVIPTTAFGFCKKLESVTFGNNLAEIHDGAFGNCESLTELTFPASLKIIGAGAFYMCSKLKTVALNEGLEEIGISTTGSAVITGAFQSCTSLTEVVFPNTVRTIGQSAYQQCSGLKKVVLNEGLWTIGNNAFARSPLGEDGAPSTLAIPSTVKEIGVGAFCGCENLGKAVFKNGEMQVLSIASAAMGPTFGGCANLTEVILPDRLKKLEHETFSGDPKLKAVYIPPSVTEIGDLVVFALTCPNLTIYGESGSAAQKYANENKIPFKEGKPPGVSVKSVTLTPAAIKEIGEDVIGKTIQLVAKISPDDAENQKVAYSSGDEQVVTVDVNGLVTISGYGKTKITVTTEDGNKTAECAVSISKYAKPQINDDLVLFPRNAKTYSAVYTGYQIRPVMTVKYADSETGNTYTLKLNADYTVEYDQNINAGDNTAVVIVKGIGEYGGESKKTFTIKQKSISGVTLSPVGDVLYEEGVDTASKIKVIVTDGVLELTRDVDYTINLSPEKPTGSNTVCKLTVAGKEGSNYTGVSSKSVSFNLIQKSNPEEEIKVNPINGENIKVKWKSPTKKYVYNGKPQKPAVEVWDGNAKVPTSKYKVLYSNNVNAGKGEVYVVGLSKNGEGYYGIYGIDPKQEFTIDKKDFSRVSVKVLSAIPKAGNIDEIKNAIANSITVSDGKNILDVNADYTIEYGAIGNMTDIKDIKVGFQYAITLKPVSGKNYTDASSKKVYIKFGQLNLASKTANVILEIKKAADGDGIIPSLSYNGVQLTENTDYTATSKLNSDNKTYTVTIKAVSNSEKTCAYKGSRTEKEVSLTE